jgi:hypothetical protein
MIASCRLEHWSYSRITALLQSSMPTLLASVGSGSGWHGWRKAASSIGRVGVVGQDSHAIIVKAALQIHRLLNNTEYLLRDNGFPGLRSLLARLKRLGRTVSLGCSPAGALGGLLLALQLGGIVPPAVDPPAAGESQTGGNQSGGQVGVDHA